MVGFCFTLTTEGTRLASRYSKELVACQVWRFPKVELFSYLLLVVFCRTSRRKSLIKFTVRFFHSKYVLEGPWNGNTPGLQCKVSFSVNRSSFWPKRTPSVKMEKKLCHRIWSAQGVKESVWRCLNSINNSIENSNDLFIILFLSSSNH